MPWKPCSPHAQEQTNALATHAQEPDEAPATASCPSATTTTAESDTFTRVETEGKAREAGTDLSAHENDLGKGAETSMIRIEKDKHIVNTRGKAQNIAGKKSKFGGKDRAFVRPDQSIVIRLFRNDRNVIGLEEEFGLGETFRHVCISSC